jgi:hypothetical protein
MLKNMDPGSAALGGAAVSFTIEVFVLEGDADAASALLGGDPDKQGLPPPALGP